VVGVLIASAITSDEPHDLEAGLAAFSAARKKFAGHLHLRDLQLSYDLYMYVEGEVSL